MKLWFFKYNFHQKHISWSEERIYVHTRTSRYWISKKFLNFFRVKDSKQYVKIQFAVRQQLKYSESLKTPEFISTSVYTSLESWKMTLKDSKKLVVVVYCTMHTYLVWNVNLTKFFNWGTPLWSRGWWLLLYSLICKVGSVRSSSNHVKQLKRRGFGFVGTTNQDLETRLYSTRRQWFRNLLRRPHCDKWITNTAKTISFFCKYSTTLTKCRKQIITTT